MLPAYRPLRRTGLAVSPVALGTMNFGAAARGADEPTAHAILDAFAARGGNLVDTADVYNGGESERIVGTWLAGAGAAAGADARAARRARVVLLTKVFFQGGRPDPNRAGLSRAHVERSLDESLARLQTDYVDVLQIHNWDARTDVRDWLRTFADLIARGKIRHYGLCNVTGWQLQRVVSTAEALGLPLPALVQCQYNLLCRPVEWEVLHCCAANGISFLPWSPLKGGWLTGRFTRDAAPDPSTRVGAVSAGAQKQLQSHPSYDQFGADPRTWALLDGMQETAAAHADAGATVPQVAVNWLLTRPMVASVIVGPRTLAQFEDLAQGAVAWAPTADEAARLTALSDVAVPYPYEMVWRCSARGGARLDGTGWPLPAAL